ncbi:cyclic pyranopterin monophosphate synthase MoaC [Patulibacter brassicae]|uniref:cyclic pyranopterin monophosphate synthase MoaC n=1 Tax=Patulibacter brassicae TaxID=1705717 RepID=UPI003872C60D
MSSDVVGQDGDVRDGTIEVEVRLFAALRESAGADRIALRLPIGATAGDAWLAAWALVDQDPPAALEHVALAVNREYASAGTRLGSGDEVALIPPVSGGQDPGAVRVVHAAVRRAPLDQAALHALVADRRAGAIATFSGTPRDVPQLDYEAHEEMAREQMAAILADVAARHGACAIAAEHRVGPVPWPEPAVVVAVSTPHRDAAFAAAREALDRIKASAPIWKEEVDGERRARPAGTLPAREGIPATVPAPATSPSAPAAPVPADDPELGRPGGLLPHLRPDGGATMVDVGAKPVTARRAVAAALVTMSPATAALVERGDLPKGDVLGTARLAGTLAAKRVPELVVLAHPLPLSKVDVRTTVVASRGEVRIEAETRTVGKTGVEIEAITAALIAAVNVYDMVKGIERGATIGPVTLVHKSGGRTGDHDAPAPWEDAAARTPGAAGPHAVVAARPTPGAAPSGATTDAVSSSASPAPTPSPSGASAPRRDARRPVDPPIRAALLTVSTTRAGGPAEDPGTQALRALAAGLRAEVAVAERVRDDRAAIAAAIARFADEHAVDVVLTAGGTGMTLDDVTPEATLEACDREVPGIAEALRLAAREHTHAWPLSRGVAAARGRTLVVNLPGTPKAAGEALPVLEPVLDHVVRLLRR